MTNLKAFQHRIHCALSAGRGLTDIDALADEIAEVSYAGTPPNNQIECLGVQGHDAAKLSHRSLRREMCRPLDGMFLPVRLDECEIELVVGKRGKIV